MPISAPTAGIRPKKFIGAQTLQNLSMYGLGRHQADSHFCSPGFDHHFGHKTNFYQCAAEMYGHI